MTAPHLAAPILVRLDRFAELRVLDDTDADEIVLQFDRPNEVTAPIFETRLTIEMAVDLIDRLVGRVTYLKGLARPDPSSVGPLSSHVLTDHHLQRQLGAPAVPKPQKPAEPPRVSDARRSWQ